MGLLDGMFGNDARSDRGGPSSVTLALLALLAYRTYQGKGRLADMLGRSPGTADGVGRIDGPGHLPGGNPAGPTETAGGGGGLADILGGLLGGGAGSRNLGGSAPGGAGGGGLADILRGGLGGLLGGAAAGSALNGGLGDLLRQFEQNGLGDKAESWIGRGSNQPVDPSDLERALGADTLQSLAQHSGQSYDEVLSELARDLPDTVDRLTPDGRMPTEDEASRWV